MELRHLRYFVAVAETGSISRAAEKLFIAQPPLSAQIRQLEEELGVPLLVRLPRGIALTSAGESFLADARAILARSQHAASARRRSTWASSASAWKRCRTRPAAPSRTPTAWRFRASTLSRTTPAR